MNKERPLHCGFAAIVGRPNSGKSTLVNNIVGEKIAIVSTVPQTTRNAIRGIYNDKRGQIVFIDTPGWHMGRDGLDKFMNKSCQNALDGIDCVIHLADTSKPVGEEEWMVVERLKNIKVPVILGLNKIDLKGEFVSQYIGLWEQARGEKITEMKNFMMLPLSGKEGTQVEKLIDLVFSFLPEAPLFYEPDTVCDIPRKQVVSDIIREKLFFLMREEIPHSIAVTVDEIRPAKGKTTRITATILVERDSQKEIVIGAKGAMIKKIGMMSRAELEELMETKVFLDLLVKTQKNWRDDHYILTDMGYSF
ncbi:MAG: GTPase Era [Candidatus Omnitrophica bacterium]|nr:GTPase Era [Candidatus Omnitrophota bacterium]